MTESHLPEEYFETGSKKGRGRAQKSLDLIEAMYAAAEAAQPITGRGIGYKLFTAGLIPSMARSEMQRVYRLLKEAREEGTIPWEWIVDETRSLERTSTWADPTEYARCVARSYRRDFWDQQPVRVEVWSEKGTIRGVLAPVLDQYAVGFRVMHGFSSATSVHDVAGDDDGRELIALYVGDYDPSGLFMSEQDLPSRLAEYDGKHVYVCRIALIREQVGDLPSFPVTDKRADPRFNWFRDRYGGRCWELRCDGPQRSPRLCSEGNHRVDRTRGVETLRGRQPGGTRIVADDPFKVEGRVMTGLVLRHALSERRDDLYETPVVAIEALLRVERLPHRLWDPCCGPGNIVRVLRAAGHEVIGSDLVDYGDPTHFYRRDFLMERKPPDGCEAITMNPPYKLSQEFIAHALELCPLVIALLRLAFMESERRTPILEGCGLARVHVFRNRLPMMHRDGWEGRKASSAVAFCWYVWDRSHAGLPTINRISWTDEAVP